MFGCVKNQVDTPYGILNIQGQSNIEIPTYIYLFKPEVKVRASEC